MSAKIVTDEFYVKDGLLNAIKIAKIDTQYWREDKKLHTVTEDDGD